MEKNRSNLSTFVRKVKIEENRTYRGMFFLPLKFSSFTDAAPHMIAWGREYAFVEASLRKIVHPLQACINQNDFSQKHIPVMETQQMP